MAECPYKRLVRLGEELLAVEAAAGGLPWRRRPELELIAPTRVFVASLTCGCGCYRVAAAWLDDGEPSGLAHYAVTVAGAPILFDAEWSIVAAVLRQLRPEVLDRRRDWRAVCAKPQAV